MESLLSECGFRNVMAATDRKWIKVDLQRSQKTGTCSLRERPQVILLPSEPYHFSELDRNDFVCLGIPRENVRLVDGVLLSWRLSRTVEALEYFRLLRLMLNPIPVRAM